MKRFRQFAWGSFVLLNGLDVLTTWVDFQHGAYEGNPLAALFLRWAGGFGGILLYKSLIVLLFSAGVLLLLRLRAVRLTHLFLIAGVALSLVPVLSNVIQVLFQTSR